MRDAKWDTGRLDSGGRNALKRDAGVMMGRNPRAMEAYYRALSSAPKNREQEEQWYACLCMECLWKPENHAAAVRFEELLRRMYQNSETSDSVKRRIIAVLDMPWSSDGYLLGKLSNFTRLMYSKNNSLMPDFCALADDLANWNHPDKYVQRRWIRTICGLAKDNDNNTDKQNEEDNENAD